MADETKPAKADPKDEAPKAAAAPEAPAEAAPAPELPAKLRMTHPYAFFEEAGRLRSWAVGEIVTDLHEIALLVERKAPAVAHAE